MTTPFSLRSLRLPLSVLLLARCLRVVSGESIRDIILQREDLSQFRLALERTGFLEGILDGKKDGDVYTVLVPSNDAIAESQLFTTYMAGIQENPPRWHHHILRATRHHILDQVSLDSKQLFEKQYDVHYSLEGPVEVSHFFNVLGGASLQTTDLKADNGYVHIVDKVIEAPFFKHSFAALTEQPEYGPDWLDRVSLKTVVDFVDGYHVYNNLLESGQTHVGCRIRALNRIGLFYLPQCINGAPETTIKTGEFLNETWKNRTVHDFLEYTLIDRNYYNPDIPDRYQELIRASNNCSDMWVTKSVTGKLCFNDGCVVKTPDHRQYLASNGYGYVVDKCIVCSGVAMLANYAAEFTNYNLRDVSQFFIASEWNLRNLSLSVGDGGKVTLFACADTGFNRFNLEDTTKLASDKWKPHQWDLLRHNILQGEYTEQDLIDLYYNNSGMEYNLTALSGQNITFDYDEEREVVLVQGGDLWFSDIKGVDGLMHFITILPVPRSVTHTVYDIVAEMADYQGQIRLIDTVFLKQDMRRLLPLTAMYAPDSDWENKLIQLEDISKVVLENHLIENLAWCEDLVEMAGTKIDTLNGQLWTVTVNEDGFPCFDTKVPGGETYKSCIVECDILARNGIVHLLDKVMLFETPETLGPQAPTVPTLSRPSAPTYFSKPSPTAGGPGLERPTFFGPTSPAYAPVDNRGGPGSAAPRSTVMWLSMAATALLLGWVLV